MKRTAVWFFIGLMCSCGAKRDAEQAGSSEPAPAPTQAAQVAALVVKDVASNAFGNRTIASDCVTVSDPATAENGALVVAARLKKSAACGEDDLLWIFSREKGAVEWEEGFLGPQVECWNGVPEAIADAVAKASGIPRCAESGG